MSEKFSAGTFLVYDTYGICKINEIKNMSLVRTAPRQTYYVLSPLNSPNSTFYLPTNSDAACSKLREPLTQEQINQLLEKSSEIQLDWIDNRQIRNESFRRIVDEGITPELIALISCLYTRKLTLGEKGKKLSGTDESIFISAEKLVKEEFAFSLKIEPESVADYIKEYLKKQKRLRTVTKITVWFLFILHIDKDKFVVV